MQKNWTSPTERTGGVPIVPAEPSCKPQDLSPVLMAPVATHISMPLVSCPRCLHGLPSEDLLPTDSTCSPHQWAFVSQVWHIVPVHGESDAGVHSDVSAQKYKHEAF